MKVFQREKEIKIIIFSKCKCYFDTLEIILYIKLRKEEDKETFDVSGYFTSVVFELTNVLLRNYK